MQKSINGGLKHLVLSQIERETILTYNMNNTLIAATRPDVQSCDHMELNFKKYLDKFQNIIINNL
jgi:hypothetical protein